MDVKNVTVWVSKPDVRRNELIANEYKIGIGNETINPNDGDFKQNSICGTFNDGMILHSKLLILRT